MITFDNKSATIAIIYKLFQAYIYRSRITIGQLYKVEIFQAIGSWIFPNPLEAPADVLLPRSEDVVRLTEKHFLSELQRNAQGNIMRKRCKVCARGNRRRDVSTYCPQCPTQPELCIACFETYHTKLSN